jgi:hypothetical protein
MNVTDELEKVLASDADRATPHEEIVRIRQKYADLVEAGLIAKKGFSLPSRQEEEQFFVLAALQLQAVRDQTLARGL